ncbi:MAG: M48 family metallopeptidase [Alicyclobacillus sp.]|nr:M48 family metallopeptidase [Alicyclobacillus sp.]
MDQPARTNDRRPEDLIPDDITLVRSRRRKSTITIQVTDSGITVRAPAETPLGTILDVLKARRSWVERVRAEIAAKRSETDRPWFDRPLYLYGNPLVFRYTPSMAGQPWRVTVDGASLSVAGPAPHAADPRVKAALERWYREEARSHLTHRVAVWSARTGLKANALRLRDQRTRWASCSAKGNLNFNWRLVMAPPDVIDYVVVHELCHLRELNHSDRFWRLVQEVLPDYRSRKAWLRTYGEQLRRF